MQPSTIIRNLPARLRIRLAVWFWLRRLRLSAPFRIGPALSPDRRDGRVADVLPNCLIDVVDRLRNLNRHMMPCHRGKPLYASKVSARRDLRKNLKLPGAAGIALALATTRAAESNQRDRPLAASA